MAENVRTIPGESYARRFARQLRENAKEVWQGAQYERPVTDTGVMADPNAMPGYERVNSRGLKDLAEVGFDWGLGPGMTLATYSPEVEGAPKVKAPGAAAKTKATTRLLRGETVTKPSAAFTPPKDKVIEMLPARPGTDLPLDMQTALRTRYPETIPGLPAVDPKTGKQYIEKQLSPEALAVQKQRQLAQKDIDAGNYSPRFDVSQRAHVDPANYPMKGETITATMPKKQATIDEHMALNNTPEIRARLTAGYLRGAKDPLSKDWYAMKQLEDEFVAELGPEAGRKAFREMWEAMAATTGGANPKDNLMMAHFGEFTRGQGQPIPTAGHELPFPIGGRYASGNLAQFSKLADTPMVEQFGTSPKRHNFAANFMGHRDLNTIDEQMMKGFDPSGKFKAPQWYGVNQSVVNDLAREQGVMPQNFQDVTWAGLGDKIGESKPMIQQVNEAIERTSRITGMTPDEVLKQNIIRKMGPLFGVGGGGVAIGSGVALDEQQRGGI